MGSRTCRTWRTWRITCLSASDHSRNLGIRMTLSDWFELLNIETTGAGRTWPFRRLSPLPRPPRRRPKLRLAVEPVTTRCHSFVGCRTPSPSLPTPGAFPRALLARLPGWGAARLPRKEGTLGRIRGHRRASRLDGAASDDLTLPAKLAAPRHETLVDRQARQFAPPKKNVQAIK